MARRKKSGEEITTSWLDTYADMVTLLLTFFVLLYASSTLDETKYQMIRQAFQNWGSFLNVVVDESQPPDSSLGDYPNQSVADPDTELPANGIPENFDQLYQYLLNYVKDNNLSESIELEKGETHVYMRFRDNVFFAGDSAVLLQEGKDILNGIAPGLAAVEDKIARLIVTGHTAYVATSPINDWNLAADRAFSVNDYIEKMAVLPSGKLELRSYGSHRPVADNSTEEGKRLNRRVEIILLRNDVDWTNPKIINDYLNMEFGYDVIDPDLIAGEEPAADENEDEQNNE